MRVIPASKLVDRIDLKEIIEPVDKLHSSNSKSKNDSDAKAIYKLTSINKTIEYNLRDVKELCETFIKSKYIKIVKSKKIIAIIKKLQKVYAKLFGLHKPTSILDKNYETLLLNELTCKS